MKWEADPGGYWRHFLVSRAFVHAGSGRMNASRH
jgi:hypothetical protein